MASLIERYADRVVGILSCYDRVIVRGSIAGFNYAEGMATYLRVQKIRLFDFPQFAKPLRDEIRLNAEQLAQKHGIAVQFLRDHKERKEAIVGRILRGTRGCLRAGSDSVRHGGMPNVRATIRPSDGAHHAAVKTWEVPALLFLFY